MAKIIQIIDTDSTGHRVRLDDGSIVSLKHSYDVPTVGAELNEDDFLFDHGKPMSIEQMKSITAFGRQYVAISDGLHGQEVPLQFDGTNWDRAEEARDDRKRG